MTDTTLDELRRAYADYYDPYADRTIAEQLDELARRRQKQPITYADRGNGLWLITSYDDISSMLRRSGREFVSFPSDPDATNVQGAQQAMIPIEIDGPRHRAFRQILDPMFAPKRVALLEEHLTKVANGLIDKWIADGRCDFVHGFSLPFPGSTVLAIMGWPLKDLERLNTWTSTIMHPDLGSEEANNQARYAAHTEIHQYFSDIIADRRANPRDDVSSMLLTAEVEGKLLTDGELFDVFLLMMLAGLDTVQSVFSQSMVYLARHQDQWQRMFDSPETLERAIEELLRWCSPAVPTRTIVADSVEVAGLRLPKGERVHGPLAAANRDPQYFPNPDEIDFDRPAKPHLSFGLGAHRCLGVHLARLELRIGFTELHRRLPAFSILEGTEPKEHLGLAWGVENVQFSFAPGPRESAGSIL